MNTVRCCIHQCLQSYTHIHTHIITAHMHTHIHQMHVDTHAFVQCVTLACFLSGSAAKYLWSKRPCRARRNAKRMKPETQRPPESCGGNGGCGGFSGTHFSNSGSLAILLGSLAILPGSLAVLPGSVLDEQGSEISC